MALFSTGVYYYNIRPALIYNSQRANYDPNNDSTEPKNKSVLCIEDLCTYAPQKYGEICLCQAGSDSAQKNNHIIEINPKAEELNNGLQKRTENPINKYSNSENIPECLICFDYIQLDDEVRKIPCKHLFHKDCIDKWLTERSDFCPTCRYCLKIN
ncbi:RING-H2 finger protein ATL77 [Smittium culicis]|uniref:RING-H2 finger protein ATL77 n=1 Tax=Smittium culicis TaxID=133412 RepID=A0A1R1X7U5_9FUNG|nr:RING-H2 finger protein ATL77 [Smittium culicis]